MFTSLTKYSRFELPRAQIWDGSRMYKLFHVERRNFSLTTLKAAQTKWCRQHQVESFIWKVFPLMRYSYIILKTLNVIMYTYSYINKEKSCFALDLVFPRLCLLEFRFFANPVETTDFSGMKRYSRVWSLSILKFT